MDGQLLGARKQKELPEELIINSPAALQGTTFFQHDAPQRRTQPAGPAKAPLPKPRGVRVGGQRGPPLPPLLSPPPFSRPSPRPIKGTARACGAWVTFFGFFPPGQGASELSEEGVVFLPGRGRLGGRRLGGRRRLLRRGCHGGDSYQKATEPGVGGKRKRRGFARLSHQRARPYSQRKRNYSKHLRLLWVCCSFPPSLGPPSLPPAHTQRRSFSTLWQPRAEPRSAPLDSRRCSFPAPSAKPRD